MITLVLCPHCNCYVEILELNCKIFRHGIYKKNYQQINPHTSKIECDKLLLNNEIYGCGKPFYIIEKQNNIYESIKCDYL
jgi:hypothetical protein